MVKVSTKRNRIKKLFFWQKGLCFYCQTTLVITNKDIKKEKRKATMDHLIPINRGGTSSASNLVLACDSCNQEKGHRMPLGFLVEKIKNNY